MQLLGILLLLCQVYLCVHAVRSGRQGWLFILLFFPGIGSLVYFLAEYLPDLRASRAPARLADTVATKLDPGLEVRRLEDRLRQTASFANKIALADAYLRQGRHDDAIALYQDAAQGVYAGEEAALRGLAAAHYEKRDLPGAEFYLRKLLGTGKRVRVTEDDLHLAQVLEETGQNEAALAQYEAIARSFPGEEARCRYALLLQRLGRSDRARELFEEILVNARSLPGHYRRANRQWVDLARRETAGA